MQKKISLLLLQVIAIIPCFAQNVGIGTTTPATRLHVSGTSNNLAIFNGGNGMFITLSEEGNNRGYIGSFAGNAEDVDFGTYGTTNGKVHLTTFNTPRLTVASAGNVGIGTTTPYVSALLDLSSTDRGVLLPRMSTAQRNSISFPVKGLITFDNNSNSFWFHTGNSWKELGGNSLSSDATLINGQTNPVNTFNMNSMPATRDSSGILYDSGGPTGNYANNESNSFEILRNGQLVTILKVVSLSLEPANDTLFIFGSGSTEILTGNKAGTYYLSGDIFILFKSNSSITQQGFTIRWDKVYAPPTSSYDPQQLTGWYFDQHLFSMRGGVNINDSWSPPNNGELSFAYGDEVIASGNYAVAFGNNNQATGFASFTYGDGNLASGSYSFAAGRSAHASGVISTALGIGTTASGTISLATGDNTKASGGNSTAFGHLTTSKSYNGMVIGQFNDSANAASPTSFNANNRLFQVGNGTSPFIRSNAMTVLQNGNIGIGTATPTKARVEINGSASTFISTYAYLNGAASTGLAGGTNNYSLYASDRIAATEFNAFSDTRIKTNLHTSDPAADLKRLIHLTVTDYNFVDTVSKGNRKIKGFIAQQVENIYPEAINTTTEFIPDLYCLSESVHWEMTNKQLTISICKPHQLKQGNRIRIYTDYGIREEKVIAIDNDYTFTLSNFDAVTAGMQPFQKVFVYGKEVADFRNIDYNKIFTLGISSIQQLAKENETLQKKNIETFLLIRDLQQQIDELKKGYKNK